MLFYLHEIPGGRLSEISHYFLVPGHSKMACDRAFGNIEEHIRQTGDVYSFGAYVNAIKSSPFITPKGTLMYQERCLSF